MSRSLDFVKQIGKDPSRSNWSDREWDNAHEVDSITVFRKNCISTKRIITHTDGTSECCDINIKIDKDENFQYCASDACLSDGTLLHYQILIENIHNKVVSGQTFYKPLGIPNKPSCINYTIGNYVVLTEYGEKFATADKPWLRERITVMLPIKVEFK